MSVARSIQASVGIASGKQCYNFLKDQDTVRQLLNLIGTGNGGAFGALNRPTQQGVCNAQLHNAILTFQRANHLSVDGHVDPHERTIELLVKLSEQDKPNVRPDDIFIPTLREPIPGFDVVAADGTIIEVPRAIIAGGRRVDVRREDAKVKVFIETAETGEKTYVVVIDNPTEETPRGQFRETPSDALEDLAEQIAKKGIEKRFGRLFGKTLLFGIGKGAALAVSVVAELIVPTPVGQVLVWNAKQGQLHVKYCVLNPPH